MRQKLFAILFGTMIAGSASAHDLASPCDQQQQSGESSCRTQNNKYLSQLSECQVRVNRDYANCVRRSARL